MFVQTLLYGVLRLASKTSATAWKLQTTSAMQLKYGCAALPAEFHRYSSHQYALHSPTKSRLLRHDQQLGACLRRWQCSSPEVSTSCIFSQIQEIQKECISLQDDRGCHRCEAVHCHNAVWMLQNLPTFSTWVDLLDSCLSRLFAAIANERHRDACGRD